MVAHKGHAVDQKVAANKIKLRQIKQSCCSFKIVAASFQNELLQIKRMVIAGMNTPKYGETLRDT